MATQDNGSPGPSGSALDRMLRVFTDVKAGESGTAILLSLNIFLILMAYYVLKPVREALILGGGSAELKTYMSAAQVVVLAFVVPFYGRLVDRMDRRRLINVVTMFFVACLVVFYVLGQMRVPLGMVFFLWIGIFNLMIVAQFWSFANDIYTKDQGERLFAIVGFGASLGAVFGSRFASRFIERLGVYELMLVGAGLLVVEVLITNYIDRREAQHGAGRQKKDGAKPIAAATPKPAEGGPSAFAMVFKTHYLLIMAFMLLLLNTVNTTGEYILGSIVREAAIAQVGSNDPQQIENIIGSFYATYFGYVNILGLLLQLFVVSRVVKYLGVSIGVMILPVISLTSYSIIAFFPLLRAVLAAKVAENSTDYSINNTIRNMLFLPCTREQKYSAKQAIDSFFVRMGDVVSALIVFLGSSVFMFHSRGFAVINAVLVVAWLVLAWRVGQQYKELTASGKPPVTVA
jgi:AAA family ATP:ADP antiporter